MFRRRRRSEEEEERGARPPELAGRQVYPPQQYAPEQVVQPAVPVVQPTGAPTSEPVTAAPHEEQPSAPPQAVPVPPVIVEGGPPVPEEPPTIGALPEEAPPGPVPEAGLPQTMVPPQYPQMMYPPPVFYPPFMMPGYMMGYPEVMGYPAPGDTGQIPVAPPTGAMQPTGAVPQGGGIPPVGVVPLQGPMPVPAPFPVPTVPPPLSPVLQPGLEDSDFEGLTREEPSHWRDDFKWVFGFITATLILLTLTAAGFYRATGPGAARRILQPVLSGATQITEYVEENYQDLRSKARRNRNANIIIPDIGIEVSISASDITESSTSQDLADRVIIEVERKLYGSGYTSDIPMKDARGVGEERAKATDATLLTMVNRNTHGAMLWVMIVVGVLALVFAVIFVLFCRGWGRLTGLGLAIIAGSLPGALLVRAANEFVWTARGSGVPYRAAMSSALHTGGSLMLPYYDIALGVGALVLLAGVIGSLVARRTRQRVPPFMDLSRSEALVEEDLMIEAGPKTDIFSG
ncbi:MAG: hypothetical protein KKF41_05935 [Actinobacteria bacterium]|nr:hypothetical protein [Actinomycetota bacterium]MBU1944828.1 hypothetical protein [Actinomycetota bacterium]MBU2687105.1 hypothetical protein [Actinomycetota bacterium]